VTTTVSLLGSLVCPVPLVGGVLCPIFGK
jgi:hypothetical protein